MDDGRAREVLRVVAEVTAALLDDDGRGAGGTAAGGGSDAGVDAVGADGDAGERALGLLAERAREVLSADGAALVLPAPDGQWLVEVTAGATAGLVGTRMPRGGRSRTAAERHRGLLVCDLSTEPRLRVPELRRFGPGMWVPLDAAGQVLGTLLAVRQVGADPFTGDDLALAAAVAGQASLALTLAESRRRSADAALLEQRAAIARDLHDFVVQELFATGLRLEQLAQAAQRGTRLTPAALRAVQHGVDEAVAAVRTTISSLRAPAAVSLPGRLHREVARARGVLGFGPDLLVSPAVGGLVLDEDLVLDVAAVVREALSNVARHAAARHVAVEVDVEVDDVDASTPYAGGEAAGGEAGGVEAGGVEAGGVEAGGDAGAASTRVAGHEALRVEVVDDGVGVPAEPAHRSGLLTMAERARRHGGSLVVGPVVPSLASDRAGPRCAGRPGGVTDRPGTRVVLTVPLR
ncbi:GAF domain-containing sensor histidine kinase [Thalassiella azotivora]